MKKLTEDCKCPVCGGYTFTLCEDFTRYSVVTLKKGVLVALFSCEEEGESDPLGSPRFLCPECGEYLEVPEELL